MEAVNVTHSRAPICLCAQAALIAACATACFAQFYFPDPMPPFGGEIISDKSPISQKRSGKPSYLETYTDPFFKTKVTRVTGDPGTPIPNRGGTWPRICRNHYQKDPPWNADGSLLYMTKGCTMILDGRTYEPTSLPNPPGPARWHPLKPDIMICLPKSGAARIIEYNVRTGDETVIAEFPGYSSLSYKSEANISGDGRWIAPVSGNKVFAYDMVEKKKYPDISLAGWSVDWASICFSGKYVVVNSKGTQNDVTQIYDAVTGKAVGAKWNTKGHPSHYDLGIDQNGDDVAVGIAKSAPNQGQVIMRRLKDGAERALCPGATHTGTRSNHRPGWAYIQNPKRGYVNEIIAVELTWEGEPTIERFAWIPIVKSEYESENHGAVSFDGRRFCAVSNWGQGGGPINAYVVDMTHLTDPIPIPGTISARPASFPHREYRFPRLIVAQIASTGAVRIRYELPEQSRVLIAVHNALGRCERTLVDAHGQKGSYTVMWLRGEHTPGVYFLRMRTGMSGAAVMKLLCR